MKYRVREIRESLRLTQEELASKSGVSRATISALESDERDVVTTTETLVKLASALQIPITDIFNLSV